MQDMMEQLKNSKGGRIPINFENNRTYKAEIYKHLGKDQSNEGISSKYNEVIIWPEFDENAPENTVVIAKRYVLGEELIEALPANKMGRGMFGGCLLYVSESGCPVSKYMPCKLQDRFE